MFRTTLARENWASKYQYNNETPLQTQERLARAVAEVEDDPEKWYDKFLNTLVKFDDAGQAVGLKNTFGGRITANLGTHYQGTTLLNCFSGDQKLVTDKGVLSFRDAVGKKIKVLVDGKFVDSEVKSFGEQQLQRVTFRHCYKQEGFHDNHKEHIFVCKKGKYSVGVEVTPNHAWTLEDGHITEDLRVGDVVPSSKLDLSKNSKESKMYIDGFRHGFIYGDGSNDYQYSNGDCKFGLRLFGAKDMRHASKFSFVKSVKWIKDGGYTEVRTNKDLKALPEKGLHSDYYTGFIDGVLAADGCILDDKRVELSNTKTELHSWVREHAPYAGMIATGYRIDYHSTETNFGKRKNLLKRLILTRSDEIYFKVASIELLLEEKEVYCAVVPKEEHFTLASGILTHNCFINGEVSNATVSYERKIPGTDKTIDVTYGTSETGDNLKNIMLTLLEQAETLKSEGGYGINFGFIRPRGSIISSIGIRHPGVVHYMSIWDQVSAVIVMGDNDGYKDTLKNYLDINDDEYEGLKKQARKGAMMGVLPIWHPDIEEFVRAKQESGMLTKFNISVCVDDKFMEAVRNNEFYDLHFEGKVYKKVKAKKLYDLIMESTYNRNEPGIIFHDNMQANNPISYLGEVTATNPCGEVPGNPITSTVCLLGSVNLTQYINEHRSFDWELYKKDVSMFARMLDNINDLTNASLPQYTWAIKNIRQYGMGINGLGSALYMMGIPYDSQDAKDFTEKVTQVKEDTCWTTSALLAEEKGTFPAYNENFLKTNWFEKYTTISPKVKDLIRIHGVRNAKVSTNPPLGNSSIICDVVSNGIEPVFMHEYERTRIADGWPEGLSKDNVKSLLIETKSGDAVVWRGSYNGVDYLYEPHNRGLCITEPVRDYGYQWVLDHYPNDIENKERYLVSTDELKVQDHIDIQEIVQKNCCQSVSKTSNIKNDYPFNDFKKLYFKAWEANLIGFTTYREGTMEAVLSKVEKNNGTREIIRKDLQLPDEFVNGKMRVIRREGMKFYIHFSYLPEDDDMIFPVAIWIQTNATGEIREANAAVKGLIGLLNKFEIDKDIIDKQREKIRGNSGRVRVAKMISMCLRHNIPIVNIVHVLDSLEDVYVTDTIFAVKKFLSEHIEEGTPVLGSNCSNPDCKSDKIIFAGGCTVCQDCGRSECN
jgi:ribonucleoside-diphosphate reductase alpha chain